MYVIYAIDSTQTTSGTRDGSPSGCRCRSSHRGEFFIGSGKRSDYTFREQDAYVLARILASSLTTRETLGHALRAYEHVRLPMANAVLQGSRDSGFMYEFNYPGLEDHYAALGPVIQSQWDWVWATHPDEEVEKGLAFLERSVKEMR